MYEQLRVRERYAEYEEAAYAKITALIATIHEAPPGTVAGIVVRREVFTTFLEKIYRRTK